MEGVRGCSMLEGGEPKLKGVGSKQREIYEDLHFALFTNSLSLLFVFNSSEYKGGYYYSQGYDLLLLYSCSPYCPSVQTATG